MGKGGGTDQHYKRITREGLCHWLAGVVTACSPRDGAASVVGQRRFHQQVGKGTRPLRVAGG